MMPAQTIPFPFFEPDKSQFNLSATSLVTNALPFADGWRPAKGLTVISSALGGECLGAVYVREADGDYTLIAGTRTGLYKLNTTDYTWADISGTDAPYSVPVGDRWSFTRFGSYLIAHTLGDDIQVFNIGTSLTFEKLAGSPPRAKYSLATGDFLFLLYLDGKPETIRWSGLNNVEQWTIGEEFCDEQYLPSGDEIMGGVPFNNGAYIFQRNAIQAMQFAPGSGFTFTRSEANPKRGCIAPLSIVEIGAGNMCYLSEDGFYMGVEGSPIGAERVDRWFFKQLDTQYLLDVRGVADPFEKIVWWSFRDATGEARMLGFDWQLNRWCMVDNDVEELAPLATPGVTWDGIDNLFNTIDDVSEPFDSRLFRGGRPTFAAFNREHKLGYFTGLNRALEAETATVGLNGSGRFFVNGMRVITDANTFTAQVASKDYHSDDLSWSDEITPSTRTKFISARSDGRLHRFRVNIPEGAAWENLTAITPEGEATGI